MLPTVCCLSMRARYAGEPGPAGCRAATPDRERRHPRHRATRCSSSIRNTRLQRCRTCRAVLAAPPPSPCALVLSIASVSAERGAAASLLLLRRRL
mmetsp:Transcript_47981/g.155177  ORF Transcript_47981/g.155177 Transcript_47981/m.155177 type:complete len:96 (+) Transcript_47981:127-414(+)